MKATEIKTQAQFRKLCRRAFKELMDDYEPVKMDIDNYLPRFLRIDDIGQERMLRITFSRGKREKP